MVCHCVPVSVQLEVSSSRWSLKEWSWLKGNSPHSLLRYSPSKGRDHRSNRLLIKNREWTLRCRFNICHLRQPSTRTTIALLLRIWWKWMTAVTRPWGRSFTCPMCEEIAVLWLTNMHSNVLYALIYTALNTQKKDGFGQRLSSTKDFLFIFLPSNHGIYLSS